VLTLKPQDALASNNLALVILRNGGDLNVALSLAETARQGMPESSNVADTLGWIYYQKGAYQSAVSLLQEALKLQQKNNLPDSANLHYHLGMAYAKTGQAKLARQQLQLMLKINPNSHDAAEATKQLSLLRS
jgi:tetratricopeptide (TPR) repeat protein